MTSYLAIRIGHALPAVLLLLGLLAHLIILWRASGGEPAALSGKLQRSRRISLPLFALLLASLPVSGWWLAHLAAIALAQSWLLISIALLPLLFIVLALLARSLRQWQQLLDTAATAEEPGSKPQIWALAWTLVLLLLLLGISALMGAKPV